MSVIWSSPLSDYNRIIASNQFAVSALTYQMWSQYWAITDLRKIDREARKIIVNNGEKHPASSTALLYLPREYGVRGLQSVESVYKDVKIKSAVKLYWNADPKMETGRRFEEHAVKSGNISLVKDAKRFAEEQRLALNLEYPEPSACAANGTNVHHTKMGEFLRKTKVVQLKETVREEKWQGKLTTQRWDDDDIRVKDWFAWLRHWTSWPSQTIAGMVELYEQLLPTRVYHGKKTRTGPNDEMSCTL